MHFCDQCQNMLYVTVSDTRLKRACRNCGAASFVDAATPELVSETVFGQDGTTAAQAYKQYMTPHIVHDPTLPRVNNIPCPSRGCTKPADAMHEVCIVKYDGVNMRYLNCCLHCLHFWRHDE